jgi:hypothetical protein
MGQSGGFNRRPGYTKFVIYFLYHHRYIKIKRSMMIENKCKRCGSKFQKIKKSFFEYCSNTCKSRDKFMTIRDKIGNEFKVWKVNFQKYPDFYLNLNSNNKLNNKCFICGKEYTAFRMCCSEKCSSNMKKETTFKTTGSEHNLSKESKSRLNMEENLTKLYGVSNVYQRDDVKNKLKETWKLKYGYDNPSKNKEIKEKKRKKLEKNGFWTPRESWPPRKVYEHNVYEITWSQMRKFAELKFGNDIWERIKKSRKLPQQEWLTVDHKFSRNRGFLENLDPSIIGHICNLEILTFKENRSKWSDCSISREELELEIKKFNSQIKNED